MQWKGKTIRVKSYSALAREHSYGRLWYLESGQSLDDYAQSLGRPLPYVADVTAILSPRVSVSQNIKLARNYLEHGSVDGVMRHRVNALQHYEATGVFNGPKVRAFARALAGDDDAVVVDAWMARLFGEPASFTAKTYDRLAAKVRRVSSNLGWRPAETQAALWCGVRALCGFKDSYSPLAMGG